MTGGGAPLRTTRIDGPAGPLEALYRPAAGPGPPSGAALICHPHPLHGGTMHSRVVFHLSRAFQEAGWATLRLNFRGAGRSAGEFDEGRGEVGDAQAALTYLRSLHPGRPLAVAGHSFGAWVGMRAGSDAPEVTLLVGVGVPLSLYQLHLPGGASAQVALIQGDRDPFGSADAIRALAAALGPRAQAVILAGGDHFLEGHLDPLRGAVRELATRAAARGLETIHPRPA